MFDRRFIDLVRAATPADKRDSRLLGGLLVALDKDLAGIPLDSGLVPSRLAAGHSARGANAGRVVRKVLQRLRGHRRPALGAATLASGVVSHWRAHPDLLVAATSTGLVRDAYVMELLEGRRDPDPATVGFLLNISVALS
jgi:asparagine synthase (glutamine-hydrolysing)